MPTRRTDEADAYLLLEQLRWGAGEVSCPHCGAAGRSYFLRPASGGDRRTRSGAVTARRVWKCGACRQQFSVLVGTVLHGTRISLWTWIAVLADWVASKRRPTARQIADRYNLSPDAAGHLLRRLELALACEPARGCAANPLH
jgi:transposase-like protein